MMASEKMVRLFIALHLPDKLKARLGELMTQLRPHAGGIKWVEPHNLHLTLKFIGDTPEEKVAAVGHAMAAALDGHKSIEVAVRGCGGFPNMRRPRVLWVGLENAEAAGVMAGSIDRQLASLGIAEEKRPFSPHLTIGRVKFPTNLTPLSVQIERAEFDAGRFVLDRVGLVKSTLTPRGPIYENLSVINLQRG